MSKEGTPPVKQVSKNSNVLTLFVCVIGIYGSFISWSILQEKISTTGYGVSQLVFKLPLVVNVIQSFFAFIVGSIYLSLKLKHITYPSQVFRDSKGKFQPVVLKYFLIISLTQSIASPIGIQSLDHVNYLIYLLAKSCKLIPVMMVQLLIFGRRFPAHKYAVAFMITSGVSIFTLFKSSGSLGSLGEGNLSIGLGLLLVSMFLDGVTNSTQDQLFALKTPNLKITGAHLMAGLNICNFTLTLLYALICTNQISYAYRFINLYPELLYNIVLFGIFGSIGQIFIFITLENFDSILLVTVTVTRKMFSMLLSVFIFGHVLNWVQWVGVALVFSGIGFEAWLKNSSKMKKKQE